MKIMLHDGNLMVMKNVYENGECKNDFALHVCEQVLQQKILVSHLSRLYLVGEGAAKQFTERQLAFLELPASDDHCSNFYCQIK